MKDLDWSTLNEEPTAVVKPPEQRLPVAVCLRAGQRWVNGPVSALMLVGLTLAVATVFAVTQVQPKSPEALAFVVAAFFGVFILWWIGAWLWWSWTVPKWRIWALRTVDDWPALKAAAIATLLIWPDGVIFERTEIKSLKQREVEKKLRLLREPGFSSR